MRCVLGVDGGNTKTIACVADMTGRIIGTGRSGCSDIYTFPAVDDAVDELALAVHAALQTAGCRQQDIVSGCFSLAGADWQEDYDDLQNALQARGFGEIVTVYNDAIGALRAGSPDGTGVVIACGTGGAIGARNAQGAFWHSSWWQDSLCGRDLGWQAIRAARHAALGIDPPTALTAHVLTHFNQPDVESVIHRFFRRPMSHPTDYELSTLAPLLLTEAENGDTTARAIVEDHARRLGQYALVAARKVGIENTPFTLILTGSIFRHPGTLLKAAAADYVRQFAPALHVVNSPYEPVIGALMLALEAAGVAITPACIAEIEQNMPPAGLFAT